MNSTAWMPISQVPGINDSNSLNELLVFDVSSAPSLSTGLRSGLTAYAVNIPQVGPPSSLWLRLCDGRTLRVGVEMHDLMDWEEIGTLTFEIVKVADTPAMACLPAAWSNVLQIDKLVHVSDECQAESGFCLTATNGEPLMVLPAADICTLAIQAPLYYNSFNPENGLADYVRSDFPACMQHKQ
ncbi:hypothetical protein [Massilia rubra]|uniref:Uncharacterized protein n=1 Tax=Massilia rubra TaxID=2607910 RepID=A0ABX0LEN0_9BURK|nr:hypothetical protein [Massilia rubra]NHZ32465.1 hypothetical protein [Massilia rubra]